MDNSEECNPVRILIACSPKSGSTYTAKVLTEYFNAERLYPQEYGGYREQNILPEFFKDTIHKSIVTQLHVLPHKPNLEYIKTLNLKIVCLRRNLADSLVSLDAHIQNEDHRTPACFIVDKDAYMRMRPEKRFDYLIRYALPWFLYFYFSWKKISCVSSRAVYKDLATDKFKFIRKIIQDLGETVSEEKLNLVISAHYENVRFNKGIVGVSSSVFSFENKFKLEDALICYPEDTSELLNELPWNVKNA